MVEEDAVGGVHAIGFAVIDGDPVAIELGDAIGAARIKRRALRLGHFLHFAVKLGGGGLIEAGGLFHAENADRLEHPQRADRVGIGGIFRRLEADLHMALGSEVIDLVRLHFLD